MQNTTGLRSCPVWSEFMKAAIQSLTAAARRLRPSGWRGRSVVCLFSGAEPSEWCPQQRSEIFAYDQLPLSRNMTCGPRRASTWTGLRASSLARISSRKICFNIQDESAVKWILETAEGNAWAEEMGFQQPIYFTPQRECTANDVRPLILFAGLSENQTINVNPLSVYALIKVPESFGNTVWSTAWATIQLIGKKFTKEISNLTSLNF